jgi:hypothetical protein
MSNAVADLCVIELIVFSNYLNVPPWLPVFGMHIEIIGFDSSSLIISSSGDVMSLALF